MRGYRWKKASNRSAPEVIKGLVAVKHQDDLSLKSGTFYLSDFLPSPQASSFEFYSVHWSFQWAYVESALDVQLISTAQLLHFKLFIEFLSGVKVRTPLVQLSESIVSDSSWLQRCLHYIFQGLDQHPGFTIWPVRWFYDSTRALDKSYRATESGGTIESILERF